MLRSAECCDDVLLLCAASLKMLLYLQRRAPGLLLLRLPLDDLQKLVF